MQIKIQMSFLAIIDTRTQNLSKNIHVQTSLKTCQESDYVYSRRRIEVVPDFWTGR